MKSIFTDLKIMDPLGNEKVQAHFGALVLCNMNVKICKSIGFCVYLSRTYYPQHHII